MAPSSSLIIFTPTLLVFHCLHCTKYFAESFLSTRSKPPSGPGPVSLTVNPCFMKCSPIIDCDNVSHKSIKWAIDELSQHGKVGIRLLAGSILKRISSSTSSLLTNITILKCFCKITVMMGVYIADCRTLSFYLIRSQLGFNVFNTRWTDLWMDSSPQTINLKKARLTHGKYFTLYCLWG